MEGFDPATSYGAEAARSYDDAARGDEDECVAFLAELAGARRALEFAVGTGRIALPLARQGVRVDGIELSPDMVEELRAKPGGAELAVTIGDMSTASMTLGGYGVVYLVFNTIFNLLTQDDQVRCFENAARHLTEDGSFVVEAAVPHAWVSRPSHVNAEHVGKDRVLIDVARYDPVSQHFERNHVELSNAGVRMGPIVLRLATPSELDLMARLAGLRLADRWGGWRREPFTAASGKHVSVYVRA